MGPKVRASGMVLRRGAVATGVVEQGAQVVVLGAADPRAIVDHEPGGSLPLALPDAQVSLWQPRTIKTSLTGQNWRRVAE